MIFIQQGQKRLIALAQFGVPCLFGKAAEV